MVLFQERRCTNQNITTINNLSCFLSITYVLPSQYCVTTKHHFLSYHFKNNEPHVISRFFFVLIYCCTLCHFSVCRDLKEVVQCLLVSTVALGSHLRWLFSLLRYEINQIYSYIRVEVFYPSGFL